MEILSWRSKTQKNYVYAVDEHYYVEPDWFYAHTDFTMNIQEMSKYLQGNMQRTRGTLN